MPRFPLLALALFLLPAVAHPADAPATPTATAATPGPADAILGRWKPPEGDVVVAISKVQGSFAGAIVESPEKPGLVGTQMFRGLTYDPGHARWVGEVFAVKKGEFVPASIRVSTGGFVLTAGKGMLSKKLAWTRVGP